MEDKLILPPLLDIKNATREEVVDWLTTFYRQQNYSLTNLKAYYSNKAFTLRRLKNQYRKIVKIMQAKGK